MANKYFPNGSQPSVQTGGRGPSQKAQGTAPKLSESNTGPDRSGGSPKTGKRGPFHVKQRGL